MSRLLRSHGAINDLRLLNSRRGQLPITQSSSSSAPQSSNHHFLHSSPSLLRHYRASRDPSNTVDDAIRNLFSAKTIHEYSAQSLLTFLVMFYSLAVVTFCTAVPAGQFVPGIMIGSTYGRLVGIFVILVPSALLVYAKTKGN